MLQQQQHLEQGQKQPNKQMLTWDLQEVNKVERKNKIEAGKATNNAIPKTHPQEQNKFNKKFPMQS